MNKILSEGEVDGGGVRQGEKKDAAPRGRKREAGGTFAAGRKGESEVESRRDAARGRRRRATSWTLCFLFISRFQ